MNELSNKGVKNGDHNELEKLALMDVVMAAQAPVFCFNAWDTSNIKKESLS